MLQYSIAYYSPSHRNMERCCPWLRRYVETRLCSRDSQSLQNKQNSFHLDGLQMRAQTWLCRLLVEQQVAPARLRQDMHMQTPRLQSFLEAN